MTRLPTRQTLRWLVLSILCSGLCSGVINSAWADDLDWKIIQSVSYETGDFGTGTRTKTLFVPLTVKRYFKKGEISLTVPYIYLETGGQVTFVGGDPTQFTNQTGPVTAHDGIGDLILKGGYYILEDDPGPFDLTLIGKVKFPTADKKDGLGTGEFDEGLGLEADKRIRKKWVLFVDAYFTYIGSPSGTYLNNRFAFDVGASYQLLSALTLSLFYDWSNALLDKNSPPQDLMAYAEYKFTKKVRGFVSGMLGLSNGSSDWGGGAGASVKF